MAMKDPHEAFSERRKYKLKTVGEKKRIIRKRSIYVTDYDIKRLNKLPEADHKKDKPDKKYPEELENKLNKAKIVVSKDIPNNVITMNSRVRLRDLDSEEELTYSLVFPKSDLSDYYLIE